MNILIKLSPHKKLIALIFMVVVIIFIPISQPGYILTVDMPWGDNFRIPYSAESSVIFIKFIEILSIVIPSWLIQKIILISIVVLGLIGTFRFISSNISDPISAYFGSLLYIFNPFFYTRLMAGHWLILVAYALLPWVLLSILTFVKKPDLKSALFVAFFASMVSIASMHLTLIIALIFVTLLVVSGRKEIAKKLKYSVVIILIWLAINVVWFVPFIAGDSVANKEVNNFSISQMNAFATNGTIIDSPPISAALLTGFWADDTNRYILPSQLPIWWVGVFIVMTLVIMGIVQIIRKRNKLGYTFIALGFTSWLLGIGIAWNVSAPLTELLIHIVPYYNGYREPHKWLMLLALVYVYLAAVGAQWVYTRIIQHKLVWVTYGFVTILFISPFLFAPTLAWGAAGQLKSVQYPQQWQDAKSYLNNHANQQDKVLVLPWHMYLPISFASRVVANPTGYYFDQQMITGNNFELVGVPNQNESPLTRYINTTLIPSGHLQTDVASQLKTYDIDYVLLLKEADWQQYDWVSKQKNLAPVVTNDKLTLYKIKGDR